MKNTLQYNYMTHKLRRFFQEEKGFVEVPAQARTSILAACEDPKTITTYYLGDALYPLPQTGQMWLEYELLKDPSLPGVFCCSTSYRDEPNPIPGRHVRIFPMFEFESHGTLESLRKLETELLLYLGFPAPKSITYEDMCARYGVNFINSQEEEILEREFGISLLLELFPQRTSPFWNMSRRTDVLYNKIDVLLHGMETIGSAERSVNKEQMEYDFYHISDGAYAQLLFNKFSKERVEQELRDYLSLDMFPRFGGGIGMTRLARAMEKSGLFDMALLLKVDSSAAYQVFV